mmetsp:Transcript_45213/g.72717  ORF Transcript_45213/g.72717 Transcript_45213/m.72717 type:complete len:80 (-) Transcript_45213:198-437(-)
MMLVKESQSSVDNGKKFFRFQTICWAPLQKRMINTKLLSKQEVAWINEFHAECYRRIEPRLRDEPEVLKWFGEATSPLD